MTSHASGSPEPGWNGHAEPGPSETPRASLLAVVAGPAEERACTIYPPDVATPYRTTTWITAHGDSFVDLDECR